MKNGTISEQKRLHQKTDTTISENAVETPKPIKTTAIETVKRQPNLDKVEIFDTSRKPIEPKAPKDARDSKCMFCKADKILNLSLQFSFVLVMFALSYHFVKKPK